MEAFPVEAGSCRTEGLPGVTPSVWLLDLLLFLRLSSSSPVHDVHPALPASSLFVLISSAEVRTAFPLQELVEGNALSSQPGVSSCSIFTTMAYWHFQHLASDARFISKNAAYAFPVSANTFVLMHVCTWEAVPLICQLSGGCYGNS